MQSKYRLLIATALAVLSTVYLVKQFSTHLVETSKLSSSSLLEAKFDALDGKVTALKKWQNKVIVLNFWATWCPPCREEMPELSELQDQYKNKNVVIIGVSTEDLETTHQFIKENPVSYPILAGDMQAMDLAETLGNNQGILPFTVVINSKGKVAKTFFGRIDLQALEKSLSSIH